MLHGRTFIKVFLTLVGVLLLGIAHAQYIMPGVWQNATIGGAEGGTSVGSLRFNSSSSAYLSRTSGSADRKTWTYSLWLKRGKLGSAANILHSFGPGGFGIEGSLSFNSSDQLDFIFDYNGGSRWRLVTDQLFRDPNAWQHIVVVADTPNSSSTDRLKIYVNGSRVTSFSTENYPSQNGNGTLWQAFSHRIGSYNGASVFFDGHATEIHYIDGQALTPSDFAEENSTTKAWQPKAFTGTYGTNGFHLDFADSADLGDDNSGNGNDWTPNNFSTSAGVNYDPSSDSPSMTSGGTNGLSNYATWNPLSGENSPTFSKANMSASFPTGTHARVLATQTFDASSNPGSYWEVTLGSNGATHGTTGFVKFPIDSSSFSYTATGSFAYISDGRLFIDGTPTVTGLPTLADGDIVGFALKGGSLFLYKNGSAVNSGAAIHTGITGEYFPAAWRASSSGAPTININAGQRSFSVNSGGAPSGFKALNTLNMPTPPIADGTDYFKTITYTGNGTYMSVGNPVKIDSTYQIGKSLRLNGTDTYLKRTFGSTTNRRIWTYSTWVKRAKLGTAQYVFSCDQSNRTTTLRFHTDDSLYFYNISSAGGGDGGELISAEKFKDTSKWYNIVIAYDSTNATASDRLQLYVDGKRVTKFSPNTQVPLNFDSQWNWSGADCAIGRYDLGAGFYLDGYMADIHFVDGQALAATDFGQFDSDGIWIPKAYAGTYGTNGFHFDFSDETDLGKDAAGSNDFTPNNFTTEATSPFEFEATGFKVGNLASLNTNTNKYVSWNWKEGAAPGLDIISYGGTGANRTVDTNLNSPPEFLMIKDRSGTNDWAIYHHKNTTAPETDRLLLNSTAATVDDATYWNDSKPGYTKLLLHGDGADASTVFTDSSIAGGHSFTVNGDTQIDTSQSKFGGSSLLFDGSGDYLTAPDSNDWNFSGDDFTVDFWMRQPSAQANDFTQLIGQWQNGGAGSAWGVFIDIDRTVSFYWYDGAMKFIQTSSTVTDNQWNHIAVVRSGSFLKVYINGVEGASGTPTTIADPTTVLQLGKSQTSSTRHYNGHLDDIRVSKGITRWTSAFTPPTTEHTVDNTDNGIFLGTNSDVNTSGNSYVAYAFDEVPGFSKFGSYTGNGDQNNGPFIYTGFEPAYIIMKRTDSSTNANWVVFDNKRKPYNWSGKDTLFADVNNAESGNTTQTVDFNTNGFKIFDSSSVNNVSGGGYIYAAFSEIPIEESSKAGAVGIASSLRLDDDAPAYLSRTFGSAGTSNKQVTFSTWIKRGSIDTSDYIIANSSGGGSEDTVRFNTNGTLDIQLAGAGAAHLVTTQMFRDPAKWMHLVLAIDTTEATAADRIKLYIDNVQVTDFSTSSYPSLNYSMTGWNAAQTCNIGRRASTGVHPFDGYLSDLHVVDGQTLSPSSFGEADSNGYWRPKTYAGTYGTNGYRLDFADSANLGSDVSGNNHDWTSNNIDTTDYVIDTPTDGFASFSSLVASANAGSANAISQGGLSTSLGSGSNLNAFTISDAMISSGKWYWEYTASQVPAAAGQWQWVGVIDASQTQELGTAVFLGNTTKSYAYDNDGNKRNDSTGAAYGDTWASGDVVGVALDLDSGKIFYSKNGVWQNSGNPASGAGFAYENVVGNYVPIIAYYRSTTETHSGNINFGQGGQTGLTFDSSSGGFFKYTPPSGFKALSTSNLPASAIPKPADYFTPVLHTGNGSSQSVNVGFAPNLTWIKDRDATNNHMIFDTERPAGAASLTSNTTGAEVENFDDATVDLFVDIPGAFSDADGEHAGYATLNPLARTDDTTLSEGNLKAAVGATTSFGAIPATISLSGDEKIYWEVKTLTNNRGVGAGEWLVGVVDEDFGYASEQGYNVAGSGFWGWHTEGRVYEDGTNVGTVTAFTENGQHISVMYDPATSKLSALVDGAPIGQDITLPTGKTWTPVIAVGSVVSGREFSVQANFGQRVFKYPAPTGYKGLSTMSVSQDSFVPDLVWIKNRDSTSSHALYDSQRGVTLEVNSDSSGAESVESNGLLGFQNGGFNVGSSSLVNTSGDGFVAWMWKKGLTPGFDIVKYTGTGGTQDVPHALGTSPNMIFVKNLSSTYDWSVLFHIDGTYYDPLYLNLTNGVGSNDRFTTVSTTTFGVANQNQTNRSGDQYVSYLWSEVEGFSKFGSYTGNGSTDGPFVYTGFKPAFVMIKKSSGTSDWVILDNARSAHNAGNLSLEPNKTTVDQVYGSGGFDFYANGFKPKEASDTMNVSGQTYIFAAFAEKPLKYSKGR